MEDEGDASMASPQAKQKHKISTAKRLMEKMMNHVFTHKEKANSKHMPVTNNAVKSVVDSDDEEEEENKRSRLSASDVFKDLPREIQDEVIGRLCGHVQGISSVEKRLPSEKEEDYRQKCFGELFNQLPSDNEFRQTFVSKYGTCPAKNFYGRVRLQTHPADGSFSNDKFKVKTFDIRGGEGGGSQGGGSSHGSTTAQCNLVNQPSA